MNNTQFDRTNTGALFKNDRAANDRAPQYKGSLNVNGVEYWVSSWIKDGQRGKFMSLSITPKEEVAAPAPAPAKRPQAKQTAPVSSGFDDLDSDIPF